MTISNTRLENASKPNPTAIAGFLGVYFRKSTGVVFMSHILQCRIGSINWPLYQVSECAAEAGRYEDAKARRVPAFQPDRGLRQESSKRKDRDP
jgi:hypothetical protein